MGRPLYVSMPVDGMPPNPVVAGTVVVDVDTHDVTVAERVVVDTGEVAVDVTTSTDADVKG